MIAHWTTPAKGMNCRVDGKTFTVLFVYDCLISYVFGQELVAIETDMIHSKRDNMPRKAWRGIKMSEARLIKRYPNRKLYDTGDSRYITLDEIAHLLADGIDIRIVDNQTKDDLTDVTLAQILVEQSRKGKLEHSVSSLKGMIKNTGEQFTKKISEPVTQLRSSVEESMTRLLKTGEERAAETRDQFHAWINQNTQAIDDIQKKVDERIWHTAGRIDILAAMKAQIDELEKRVQALESKSDQPNSD